MGTWNLTADGSFVNSTDEANFRAGLQTLFQQYAAIVTDLNYSATTATLTFAGGVVKVGV